MTAPSRESLLEAVVDVLRPVLERVQFEEGDMWCYYGDDIRRVEAALQALAALPPRAAEPPPAPAAPPDGAREAAAEECAWRLRLHVEQDTMRNVFNCPGCKAALEKLDKAAATRHGGERRAR